MKVHIVSSEDAIEIVEHPRESERGLFLVDMSRWTTPCWLAIDNTTGHAFAKKFDSRELAEMWLKDGTGAN